jgi:hypothetical protein
MESCNCRKPLVLRQIAAFLSCMACKRSGVQVPYPPFPSLFAAITWGDDFPKELKVLRDDDSKTKACLIASSSAWVIGEAPLSFRQTVLWCQPSRQASLVCPPVPRSSLIESQMALRSAVVTRNAEHCIRSAGGVVRHRPQAVAALRIQLVELNREASRGYGD